MVALVGSGVSMSTPSRSSPGGTVKVIGAAAWPPAAGSGRLGALTASVTGLPNWVAGLSTRYEPRTSVGSLLVLNRFTVCELTPAGAVMSNWDGDAIRLFVPCELVEAPGS